jgi:hypothetical protein
VNRRRPERGKTTEKRIFCLKGQRNRLKKLDPEKRIQGNPSLFASISFAVPWPGLAGLGKIWIWLGQTLTHKPDV